MNLGANQVAGCGLARTTFGMDTAHIRIEDSGTEAGKQQKNTIHIYILYIYIYIFTLSLIVNSCDMDKQNRRVSYSPNKKTASCNYRNCYGTKITKAYRAARFQVHILEKTRK